MAKGMALTIGLNAVNPRHYEGWKGELNACEADAGDMAEIALAQKFKVQTLLRSAPLGLPCSPAWPGRRKRSRRATSFCLSYSGHGGQVPTATATRPITRMRRGACTTVS